MGLSSDGNGKAQATLRSGCREDRRVAAGRGCFYRYRFGWRSSNGLGFRAGHQL